jgi:hypothetical protein
MSLNNGLALAPGKMRNVLWYDNKRSCREFPRRSKIKSFAQAHHPCAGDLRGSPFIAVDAWYSIVLDGALKDGGMAPFGSVLDRAQAAAILDYVVHRANEDAKPVKLAFGII